MNYRNFTVDDFLADDFFQRWALFPDNESEEFWENWIGENPDKKMIIEQALWLVKNIDFSDKWNAQEKADMWKNIQLELIPSENVRKPFFRLTGRKIWLAAASITFLLASIGILVSKFQMKEISTEFGQIKKITLSDGSVVTLNANSRLRYAKDFGTNLTSVLNGQGLNGEKTAGQPGGREIWIDGEAYFDVAKRTVNGKRLPFIVHANDLSIQVLGTAFNVTNRRGTVNIALDHGAVKIVDQKNKNNTMFLKPGESVTQSAQKPLLFKEKVDVEEYSSWKNKVIIFKKKSLKEIAEMMKDLYNIQVVIDNPALSSETFTGSFPTDSSDVLFQKLQKMYPMEVTKQDNEYHLR